MENPNELAKALKAIVQMAGGTALAQLAMIGPRLNAALDQQIELGRAKYEKQVADLTIMLAMLNTNVSKLVQ
jgi:hypothetical protein